MADDVFELLADRLSREDVLLELPDLESEDTAGCSIYASEPNDHAGVIARFWGGTVSRRVKFLFKLSYGKFMKRGPYSLQIGVATCIRT